MRPATGTVSASLIGLLVAVIWLPGPASWGKSGPLPALEAVDARSVRIGDCRQRWQMDQVRDWYLRVPNDDLLKGFRRRAGKAAPGIEPGGWYASDHFHVFGQVVSGLSRMYAATGDARCKDKVNALLEGWAKCIAPDGYFYYSAATPHPAYIYEKMVSGLVDAHLYAGNKTALPLLSRITDWAIANITQPAMHDEWYTLSEGLYRAYEVTKDTKYLSFARRWEYTDYWNAYAERGSPFPVSPEGEAEKKFHAYSHVNTLCGAAMAYRCSGENRYLRTITRAYDYLSKNQMYATGGYGPLERLMPPERLPATLETTMRSFEASCGSWAGFKLSKYLISLTGDARYGDWIELLLYNGIGASIDNSPSGDVYYYSDYNIGGGLKQHTVVPWACCAGTRIQAVADYPGLIYFRSADSLCVNLFIPSTVKWNVGPVPVTVEQVTRFPEVPATSLRVVCSRPVSFRLRVRVPGWLASPITAAINGKPVPVHTDDLRWAVFKRKWRSGDVLSLSLPMKFTLQRFPASSSEAYPAAITLGPVVMSARADANPARALGLDDLPKALVPVPGDPLTFRCGSAPEVLLMPYNAVRQGERHFVYFDPHADITNRLPRDLRFSGGWRAAGDMMVTNKADETVRLAFAGVGIRWLGYWHDDAGMAEVSIDSSAPIIVDQFAMDRAGPVWESPKLAPGQHSLTIKSLGKGSRGSKGVFLNVSALAVVDQPQRPPEEQRQTSAPSFRPSLTIFTFASSLVPSLYCLSAASRHSAGGDSGHGPAAISCFGGRAGVIGTACDGLEEVIAAARKPLEAAPPEPPPIQPTLF